MMGSHPLDDSEKHKLGDSLDSLTKDAPAEQYSSTHSTMPSSVSAHPLANHNGNEYEDPAEPFVDELSVDKTEADVHEEDEDDEDNLEDDMRIASTAGKSRYIHQSSSSDREFLNIIVTQPQKEIDYAGTSLLPGGNYYITYLISARTNLEMYGKPDHSVRRRFKEVLALADSLVEKYRGYFVPCRPDKSIVDSQIMDKQHFVELRRGEIEKYLRRVASHPVLRKSEDLKLFLTYTGPLPFAPTLDVASRMLDGAAKLPKQLFGDGSAVVNPNEVVHSAKGGRDLLRLFKELKQSVTNEWSSNKPLVVEEDKEFLEKRASLHEYERRLSHTTQQADLFLKAQERLAIVMGDHTGLSFCKLAKLETQNASTSVQRAHAMNVRKMGTTILRVSRLQRASKYQAYRHLDYLNEHLALLQSANAAFAERDNALLTVQTLLSDISVMHTKAEKLSATASRVFGGDRSRNKKVEDLRESIKATEQACQYAQHKYNHIKDNNRMEIERIETEKQEQFKQMLRGFVQSQVGHAEKISREWSHMADEFSEYSGKRLESTFSYRTSPSFHG